MIDKFLIKFFFTPFLIAIIDTFFLVKLSSLTLSLSPLNQHQSLYKRKKALKVQFSSSMVNVGVNWKINEIIAIEMLS